MNQTFSFEGILRRLWSQSNVARKFLIGGLLSFVPVVNLFAFGYLYRYAQSIRRSGSFILPEWEDWPGLFRDGVRMLVAGLLYWIAPGLVLWAVVALWCLLPLWVVGDAVGYVVMVVGMTFLPFLFAAAVYRLQMRSELSDLLDYRIIFLMTWHKVTDWIVPALCLAGWTALTWPLYGFSIFALVGVLLVYTTVLFRSLEKRPISGL